MPADDRADRVLDAAADLICRYGADKTTIEDIAHAAGIAKGAVYLEFRGRDDLIEALMARESRRLLREVLRRVEGDPHGGTLAGIYRHWIAAATANPFMRALLTHDSRVLGRMVHRHPPERYTRRLAFGGELVRRLQDAGLVRPELDADMTAFLMGSLAYGLMTIEGVLTPGMAPPPEQTGEPLADLVQRGWGTTSGDSDAGTQALARFVEDVQRQLDADASGERSGHAP